MADTAVSGDRPRIFLTGATGYVGGRLLGALERSGYRVRCLARQLSATMSPHSGSSPATTPASRTPKPAASR
jgi:nucleoside-diphosphate-sugar epimerase